MRTVVIDDAAEFLVSTWSIVMSGGYHLSAGNVGPKPAPSCWTASR